MLRASARLSPAFGHDTPFGTPIYRSVRHRQYRTLQPEVRDFYSSSSSVARAVHKTVTKRFDRTVIVVSSTPKSATNRIQVTTSAFMGIYEPLKSVDVEVRVSSPKSLF
jgi:hypothetical protein